MTTPLFSPARLPPTLSTALVLLATALLVPAPLAPTLLAPRLLPPRSPCSMMIDERHKHHIISLSNARR